MAVRIRLRRMGAKKQPFYRVVVADSRSPRDGRFLDTIGTFNPRSSDIRIDREKALRWLEDGADPTDSARSLLSKAGIWQEFRTGVAPEPRPTPAEPAETVPEPVVESATEEVETEIEREEAPAVATREAEPEPGEVEPESGEAKAEEVGEAPPEEAEEK